MKKNKGKLFTAFMLAMFMFACLSTILIYPIKAQSYVVTVGAYDDAEGTSVSGVEIDLDEVYFDDTPTYFDSTDNPSTVSCNVTDSYGNNFQYWDISGYYYTENTVYIESWIYLQQYWTFTAHFDSGETPPTGENGTGDYTLYGPFNENTGTLLDQNVLVTAYYTQAGVSPRQFTLNGQYGFNTTYTPQYFLYRFEDNSTREYWVDPSEETTSLYVFYGDTTEYVINFLDTTGILTTYPYVTAKRYVNGSLFTIEKRKVDLYNSVIMNLINTRTYQVILGNEETTYVFGDLTMTASTAVQLTLRGVDFPTEITQLYKYVRIYGVRNYTGETTDTITIYYDDTKENTNSVTIDLNYANGTTAYTTTVSATDSFSVEWESAEPEISYYADVTIDHGDYGEYSWKQTFSGSNAGSAPFGLQFLGDWGDFDSSMLIPAFVILCAAGCFSKLNAEVGAIVMCITAVIVGPVMGWIPIPIGLLVAAFSFAVLMALVYHKRSVN